MNKLNKNYFIVLPAVVMGLILTNTAWAQSRTITAQDGHVVGKGCEALHKSIDIAAGDPALVDEVLSLFPQSFCTAGSLLAFVLNLLLSLVGLVAVIFIMVGGYQYITGMTTGGKEAVGKGKQTITNAVLGLIVVIMAAAIVNIVISLLSN